MNEEILYTIFSTLVFCFSITMMFNSMKTEWELNESFGNEQQYHETMLVSAEESEIDRTVTQADIILEIKNADYQTIIVNGETIPDTIVKKIRKNDIEIPEIENYIETDEYIKKEIYSSNGSIYGIEYVERTD